MILEKERRLKRRTYGSDGERKSGGKRGKIVLTVRCWRGEGSGGGGEIPITSYLCEVGWPVRGSAENDKR